MAEQIRRFLRLKQVIQLVGYQRSAIYKKIETGEFPAPYPLSDNGRAVAWASNEIDKWIDSRIKAAGGATRLGGAA